MVKPPRAVFVETYVFGKETVYIIATDLNVKEPTRYTLFKTSLGGEKLTYVVAESLSLKHARKLVRRHLCV